MTAPRLKSRSDVAMTYFSLAISLARRPVVRVSVAALAMAASGCECGDASYITSREPPLINVATDEVDFGSIPVGFSVERKLRMVNAGDEILDYSARLEGDAAFALPVASNRVAGGGDDELLLRFSPLQEGLVEATLHLSSNDPNTPELVVRVKGRGIADTLCGDCNAPPRGYCATPDAAVTYARQGVCVDGACRYDLSVLSCPLGCDDETGTCFGSAPPEPDGGGDAGPNQDPDAGDVADDAGAAEPPVGGACPEPFGDEADLSVPCQGVTELTQAGVYRIAVPDGCAGAILEAWGGGGGGGAGVTQGATNLEGGAGGGAAYARETLSFGAGDVLRIHVAQGGAAGGCVSGAQGGQPGGGRGGQSPASAGSGDGGGGGGMTRVLQNGSEVLVAAGGGGGGGHGWGSFFIAGSGGGGAAEAGTAGAAIDTTNGLCPEASAGGGGGGSQSAGGPGGPGEFPGANGTRGEGGGGADAVGDTGDPGGGGGGGAGYYGGGGGASTWHCNASGAGGGGGSSRGAERIAAEGAAPGRATSSGGAGVGGAGGHQGFAGAAGMAGSSGRLRLTWQPQ